MVSEGKSRIKDDPQNHVQRTKTEGWEPKLHGVKLSIDPRNIVGDYDFTSIYSIH